MGNLDFDWEMISSILGPIIFVATTLAVFVWTSLFRPSALRAKDAGRQEVTLDWKTIGEIVLQCSSLSGGIVLLLNVAIFILTGIWSLDSRSLGVIALAFALMLFRSFDGFLTRLKRII